MDERIKPGCIAVCRSGVKAIVKDKGRSPVDGSEVWVGESLGGKPWYSWNPTFVAESLAEYLTTEQD